MTPHADGASSAPLPQEPAPRRPPISQRPCILFDFDGTLANTAPGIVDIARQVLGEFGMSEAEMGDLTRLVGPPFPAAFSQIYGMSPERAEQVGARYREVYRSLGPETHPLYEGIFELLHDLAATGRRLAVTTSKGRDLALRFLADDGVADVFEVVVGKVDPAKSDKPRLVARTLEVLGCPACEAVMVGDRLYDVEGAHANGVTCVGVRYGGTAPEGELEEAGADVIVRTAAELGDVLMVSRA